MTPELWRTLAVVADVWSLLILILVVALIITVIRWW